jgi:hypothetical protein
MLKVLEHFLKTNLSPLIMSPKKTAGQGRVGFYFSKKLTNNFPLLAGCGNPQHRLPTVNPTAIQASDAVRAVLF